MSYDPYELDPDIVENLAKIFVDNCPSCGGNLMKSYPTGMFLKDLLCKGDILIKVCSEIDCDYCTVTLRPDLEYDESIQEILDELVNNINFSFRRLNTLLKIVF
jgi:hypothetical protein